MKGRLTARARQVVAPLSPSGLLLVLVVIIVLVALQSSAGAHWGPLRWSETSAAFRESTAFAGPVAAAAAAWTARVRHLVVCGAVPGRGWPDVVRRHLLVLLPTVLLGMLVALVPAVAQTASRASVGGLDVLVALSGVLSLVAWVATGYLMGSLLSARTGAALTLFGGLLVTVALPVASDALTADGAPRSLYSFSPVWGMSIRVGWEEVPSTAAFRCVLALTVAAAAIAVTMSLDDTGKRSGGTSPRWFSFLPLGAPALLVVAALMVQPHLLEPRDSGGDVCAAAGSVTVCLSDEEAALVPTAVSAVSEVLSLAGEHVPVDRLVWADSAERNSPRTVVTGGDRPRTQAEYRAMFVRDFSSGVAGVPSCWARAEAEVEPGAPIPAELSDAWATSALVASALQVRLGVTPSDDPVYLDPDTGAAAATAVSSLDTHELRLMIGSHQAALSACRSSLADIAR